MADTSPAGTNGPDTLGTKLKRRWTDLENVRLTIFQMFTICGLLVTIVVSNYNGQSGIEKSIGGLRSDLRDVITRMDKNKEIDTILNAQRDARIIELEKDNKMQDVRLRLLEDAFARQGVKVGGQ